MHPIRFHDPRYFQLFSQFIFLTAGYLLFHQQQPLLHVFLYVSTAIVTQVICDTVLHSITKKEFHVGDLLIKNMPSALVSAMGLSLLLKTTHPAFAVLASVIAISSKFLIRIRGKHIFNPSALAIVLLVWVFPVAWFNPGQWGSGWVQVFAVLLLGIVVVTRVQKLDSSLAFLGTYLTLTGIRQLYFLGWPPDHYLQSISTGSLLVFSFFMISDPKTLPNHPWARIGWAMLVAVLGFWLQAYRFIPGGPVLALVLAQPLVPLLDACFRSAAFRWPGHKNMPIPAT